jgi:hypothetical protein
LCTRTNEHGGYFAPPGVFLAIYIALCIIWAMLNTCAINVIAIIDTASIYWQVNMISLIMCMELVHHIYPKHPAFKGSDNATYILRNTHVMLEKIFPILKNPLQLPMD